MSKYYCYRCNGPDAFLVRTAVGVVKMCKICFQELKALGDRIALNSTDGYTLEIIETGEKMEGAKDE